MTIKDSEVFETTIDQVECEIADVVGDGAYDSKNCYDVCAAKNINPIFPPRAGAVIRQHGNAKKDPLPRDQAIRSIKALGSKGWKEQVDYHRRSLVETTMFRFKQLFTEKLSTRKFTNQAKEIFIKCKILNQFACMGLANSLLSIG